MQSVRSSAALYVAKRDASHGINYNVSARNCLCTTPWDSFTYERRPRRQQNNCLSSTQQRQRHAPLQLCRRLRWLPIAYNAPQGSPSLYQAHIELSFGEDDPGLGNNLSRVSIRVEEATPHIYLCQTPYPRVSHCTRQCLQDFGHWKPQDPVGSDHNRSLIDILFNVNKSEQNLVERPMSI